MKHIKTFEDLGEIKEYDENKFYIIKYLFKYYFLIKNVKLSKSNTVIEFSYYMNNGDFNKDIVYLIDVEFIDSFDNLNDAYQEYRNIIDIEKNTNKYNL